MAVVVAVHLPQRLHEARKFQAVKALQRVSALCEIIPARNSGAVLECKNDDVAGFFRRQTQRACGKRGLDAQQSFVELAVAAPQVHHQDAARIEAHAASVVKRRIGQFRGL